jgi:hypothetical protein
MRLRYMRDRSITVNWSDSPDRKNPEFTVFCPEGETTDKRGKGLLASREYKGWFVEVPPVKEIAVEEPKAAFPCDVCGHQAKSKAGLGSHKRKHKEQ